jgi:hypothetical protein
MRTGERFFEEGAISYRPVADGHAALKKHKQKTKGLEIVFDPESHK